MQARAVGLQHSAANPPINAERLLAILTIPYFNANPEVVAFRADTKITVRGTRKGLYSPVYVL